MTAPWQLAFVGGGTMAEALVKGLIGRGVHAPQKLLVSDPLPSRLAHLRETYGVATTLDNRECLRARAVLLAVKPAQLAAVLAQLAPEWPASLPGLSIVAGARLDQLASYFADGCPPLVRAMPNTCATIGQGITSLAWNAQTPPEVQDAARAIFASVGETVDLPESYFDAVTGLSGSGPAYVTLIIEALIEAGVQQGLPRRISRELVCQTVAGAALLVKDSGMHPAELKDQVVTPAGTTAAGLQVLEEAAIRATFCLAVHAATARSRTLGQEAVR
ncbi:MAG: pyrroline-5-carboxylate reductase [Candidatus Sericytochromatia bacterium]|nr:pyrroline-5-carboxylate reductase [Candidatus Sericytochromatia bacterium]